MPQHALPPLGAEVLGPPPIGGGILGAESATIETAPAEPPTDTTPTLLAFGQEALAGLNPVAIHRAIQSAFWHPIATVKGVLSAQDQVRHAAIEAFQQGDYVTGTAKLVDWLVPLLGPRLSESGEFLARGETARGLGAATDVGLQVAGPMAIQRGTAMRVSPAMRPRNPVQREAVLFGERQGVPLEAGTATGRQVIQTIQKRATDSLGGAGVAEPFRLRQAERLAAVGEQQAARATPGPPITPEQAGAGVRATVAGRAADFHAQASRAYDTLRKIEQTAPAQTRSLQPGAPIESMRLAVDLRAAKTALTPIKDALERRYPVTQREASSGLKAIQNIVDGPDFGPLSQVDADLSAIKGIARSDLEFSRTVSQGLAAQAVSALNTAVETTARLHSPQALQALLRGRAATVQKYKALGVLDQISAEPVQAFRQATYAKDAGIAQLREVARLAPDELPRVGRAYLEDLMETATTEGGFGHADKLFAQWQRLGPETKKLLFREPGHVQDLDRFFLLAKSIAANPNPSGTARVLTAFNVAAMVPAYAVARLLYSPRGVRLLTQGLRIPVGQRAAATVWAAEVSRAVGEMGPAAVVGRAADRDTTAGSPP